MANKNEYLNVYWAPAVILEDPNQNWDAAYGGYLYPDIKTLHAELMEEKNPHRGPSTYLSCPASKTVFNRTAVIYNSMACSYKYDLADVNKMVVTPETDTAMMLAIMRPPALLNKPTIEFQLRWIFFCEEPLNMTITPPMFHRPKYMKYGTITPGSYDIGRWFRPVTFEVQLWDPVGRLEFESGEPLMYASFDTDRKIKMNRFKFTHSLAQYSKTGIDSTLGQGMSLDDRYELFDSISMRELILGEIKNNLVENVE